MSHYVSLSNLYKLGILPNKVPAARPVHVACTVKLAVPAGVSAVFQCECSNELVRQSAWVLTG